MGCQLHGMQEVSCWAVARHPRSQDGVQGLPAQRLEGDDPYVARHPRSQDGVQDRGRDRPPRRLPVARHPRSQDGVQAPTPGTGPGTGRTVARHPRSQDGVQGAVACTCSAACSSRKASPKSRWSAGASENRRCRPRGLSQGIPEVKMECRRQASRRGPGEGPGRRKASPKSRWSAGRSSMRRSSSASRSQGIPEVKMECRVGAALGQSRGGADSRKASPKSRWSAGGPARCGAVARRSQGIPEVKMECRVRDASQAAAPRGVARHPRSQDGVQDSPLLSFLSGCQSSQGIPEVKMECRLGPVQIQQPHSLSRKASPKSRWSAGTTGWAAAAPSPAVARHPRSQDGVQVAAARLPSGRARDVSQGIPEVKMECRLDPVGHTGAPPVVARHPRSQDGVQARVWAGLAATEFGRKASPKSGWSAGCVCRAHLAFQHARRKASPKSGWSAGWRH